MTKKRLFIKNKVYICSEFKNDCKMSFILSDQPNFRVDFFYRWGDRKDNDFEKFNAGDEDDCRNQFNNWLLNEAPKCISIGINKETIEIKKL